MHLDCAIKRAASMIRVLFSVSNQPVTRLFSVPHTGIVAILILLTGISAFAANPNCDFHFLSSDSVETDRSGTAPIGEALIPTSGTISQPAHFSIDRPELRPLHASLAVNTRAAEYGLSRYNRQGFKHIPAGPGVLSFAQGPGGPLFAGTKIISALFYDWKYIGLAVAISLEALLVVILIKTALRRLQVERHLARLLVVVKLESCLATNIINLALGAVRTEIDCRNNQFSQLIGIDCISIYEIQQETSQFRLLGYSSVPGTTLRLAQLNPSEFKQTARKLLSGQSVVVRTVADLPQESSNVMQVLRKSGLQSFAGIPVFVDKRVVGALFFSSAGAPDWPDTLLGELQLVADMVGSGLDRARLHDSFARSEQLKSAILSSLPALVVVLDRNGRVIDFNRSATTAFFECDFGQTSLSLGMDYQEFYRKAAGQGSGHAQAALNGLQSVLSRTTADFEIEYPWGSAQPQCWTRLHAVPLSGEQGGVVVTHSDVTDRRLAELEREQLETARGELSGRLLRAQEEERARIARELHDDINQKLSLLAADIQTLQKNSPKRREDLFTRLQGLFTTTNHIATDIQRLSYQLHSFRLDYLGLAAAVRRLCAEFTEQHQIPVECVIENVPNRLSGEIELGLFRVLQECLSNIARHSFATRVAVLLRCQEKTVCMNVSDNGIGFSPAAHDVRKESGLGLISMRERLRLIHGDFDIHSETGAGTKITAAVPLREERPTEITDSRIEKKLA